ncbi:hypothetical protein CHLNCDRAFT_134361 [Chlorella variabilis]|uniref:Gamma-soluble NSF attachment protein n=1 Tax=Chlorella variabilis TaxID=554065 RepID=E1ZFU9_CHLVA|nr:hypothetical protein CHLNCDRAFT_134361 [Chlorella variabilis]EFN55347.1 hypothetical protein CHLNCDRAFT_134361 [Chlorella variabilis]|eukprot:XP_005847449.1 hypothetical protein CHLNCDRAFT_134361 [Chlorella variabilis]
MVDRHKEAEKLYQEAVKLTTPSLLSFRMRGEWERATPLWERAAMLFKQCGDVNRAKDCYEHAATGQERQKSGWHAAKNMEKAGEAAKELGMWADVEAHYSRAAQLYAEEGRPSAAAEAAARGARALEERQPEMSQEMYRKAVEWLEDAGKDAMAGDIFRQAVAQLVRAGKWADAVGMLLRFAVACDGMGARNSECKAYLGAVVDALGVDNFMSSDEAFAADALFDAYRRQGQRQQERGDPAAIQAAVARLARKLPQGDLAVQAVQLGGSGGGAGVAIDEEGEEDLT